MAAVTLTVKPTGGQYTTLGAAIAGALASENGSKPTLTTDNGSGSAGILNIAIGGTWSSVDSSSQVLIDGFTSDANNYLNIYTVSPARHAGVWSTSKYILQGSNGGEIWIKDKNVHIDGLQIDCSNVTANKYALYTNESSAVLWFSNLLVKVGPPSGANEHNVAYFNAASSTIHMWNCVGYNVGLSNGDMIYPTQGTLNIYNCVMKGGSHGISVGGATVNAKNVYCGGASTEDFARYTGSLAKTNCGSSDQSADDTGTGETQSNCLAAAVPVSTATFINVTGGAEDFHLAGTSSALYHTGVDTSGESAPLNFTTDIDGDTYYSTRSVGADEIVSTATNVVQFII